MKSNAKIRHSVKHATKKVRKTKVTSNTKKTLVKREPSVVGAIVPNQAAKIVQSWVRATSEAIAEFDFERAAEYYEKLDWGWAKDINDNDVLEREAPTAYEIRNEVTRMINVCIDGVMADPNEHSCYHCSTGGLYVMAHKYPNPEDNWIWVGMTVVETMY